MKRFIITEEEKQHIKSLYEQRFLKRIFSTGDEDVKTVIKQEIPISHQLSRDVQKLISELPTKVNVGTELLDLFGKHSNNIKSLKQKLQNYKEFGILEIYIKKISNTISSKRGTPINLQELYNDANLLKKHLVNIKKSISKPKEGGLLNKNVNYKKDVEVWYNTLNTEIGNLSSFIKDLENL